MPEYRRRYEPGAAYFFTVVTERRMPLFNNARARALLHEAFVQTRRRMPFELWATVLLPDHLHCIWVLPPADADFSTRWSMLKRRFSQDWLAAEGRRRRLTPSQAKHRESGVWQRRFWEHVIRDERELFAYRDYVHLNSVKHGLVSHPHDWKWSSVHRHLRDGWLTPDWTAAPPVSVDVRGEVR